MAFCINRGQKLAEEAKFCHNCGTAIANEAEEQKDPLDVDLSAKIILSGAKSGTSDVEIYFEHLSKAIMVKIPNDISVGQILRLRGLGHTSPSGQKGDIYLQIAHIEYENAQQKHREPHRKVDYEGEIRKCLNCGEPLSAFSVTCPSCGLEIRDRKTSKAIQEFAVKLSQANGQEEKIEVIYSFPVPNTKEDIFEFLILASSNVDGRINESLVDAWSVKLSQIYKKAELSFANDPDFLEVQKLYTQAQKKIRAQKSMQTTKNTANGVMHALSNILIACPGLVLIAIGMVLPRYEDMSTVLIILGGVVLAIMSVYYAKKAMVAVGVGSGIIVIGLACILSRYDDRRTILFIIGALIFIVLAVTLAKNKQKP